MATAIVPQPFQPGFNLEDGTVLNAVFANPAIASQDGITATASATQTTAFQLTTLMSRITTVANANDGVRLPKANVGIEAIVVNSGTNAMQVFGFGTDTINSVATATGVSQAAGTASAYRCFTAGNWIQVGTSSFTNVTITSLLTYPTSSGRVGTFVTNGATPVTVTNTLVTANSMIFCSIHTPSGTPAGAPPNVSAITPATNFVTKGTASDTSTYNYMIIESA